LDGVSDLDGGGHGLSGWDGWMVDVMIDEMDSAEIFPNEC
jgi:hypothetical protein